MLPFDPPFLGWSVWPWVSLSVCPLILPFVLPFVCPSFRPFFYPSVLLSVRPFICLSFYPFFLLSVCPSIWFRSSVFPSVRLSFRPSVRLFVTASNSDTLSNTVFSPPGISPSSSGRRLRRRRRQSPNHGSFRHRLTRREPTADPKPFVSSVTRRKTVTA